MTALFTNKADIVQFLNNYHPITDYSIRDDLTVDINGNVNLVGNDWEHLPIQFGIVTGDFCCSRNKLKSLKGCPSEVHGDFMCSENELTSLEYGPAFVGKDYYCYSNKLTNLNFIPKTLLADLIARDNLLTTLVGGPEVISKNFYFENNLVTNFHGVASYIGGFIKSNNNPIMSLDLLTGKFTTLFFSSEKSNIQDIEEFSDTSGDGTYAINHHRMQNFLLYRRLFALCEKPPMQAVKI
jgi:hypothetical protein